jgi:imidazoleglycerol-phosphate dehydratase
MRIAEITRKTNETEIAVSLNLDGSGAARIQTGLGFFDHMLQQVAVHGLLDLKLEARGDLQVDPHHTVEDSALALGEAIDRALGERGGIVRMGSAYVPMDESLAFVSLDLSGRPYAVIQAEWHAPRVGELPTSLILHFFESVAVSARMNLHGRVLYGRDDHHQAEALFKAFGRALDAAVRVDPRRQGRIPSTKGKLV